MLSVEDLASFNVDGENEKNIVVLARMGGVKSFEKQLKTSFSKGLSSSDAKDLAMRREMHGKNEFPEPEYDTWFDMFKESFEDATLIILIVSAVVSFAVGFYEDPEKGWIEGAAILFAVMIVAVVTTQNNYNKEQQFRKLNKQKDDIEVGVVRDGSVTQIDIKELVVGDIAVLNAGDKVPADGIFVSGSDVSVDESALTGEPDDLKKEKGGDEFLLSGTALSTGYCKMIVCAVGENSRWGKTKAKLAAETVETPLQAKLNTLAEQIGYFGMASAVATATAMVSLWLMYPESREEGVTLFDYCLKAFIMGVTIVVVAVPEGLPLAVTLSLAYSTQKMMKDNNLIRVLAACETMGNATNICSDKTGTLTQNRMTVVAGWIGGADQGEGKTFLTKPKNLPSNLIEFISEGISINTTANLMATDDKNGEPPVVTGSKTEGALLIMIKDKFGVEYKPIRASFDENRGDRLITFSSLRKRMTVVLAKEKKGGISYTKGASEIVVALCTSYINSKGDVVPFDESVKRIVNDVIESMAKRSLRTIALAHKKFQCSPSSIKDKDPDFFETELTLDGICGIQDPLRPDVTEAVLACQKAGIFVRMVTGDNIETAKAIATECGIYTEKTGGIAMEGPVFRNMTPAEVDKILPNLQVLARSSPDDKHTLVTRLNGHALPANQEEWEVLHPKKSWSAHRDLLLPGYKEEWEKSRGKGLGEVVGVTGDGTNDGPALKAADVGLSMGLSGTDVAKEASDIVILDDNFSSIVKSVLWGRSVFDNIRKFLQFQLTVNVVALSLTFVAALTGKDPPLNAVMMLWVNMIMDTMGALALGTEPPSNTLLDRLPYKRNASLVSNKMYRHILIQFVFQMAILCYLIYYAAPHFGVATDSIQHITVIFNTFVFCQVFNEVNARSIDDDMNVFKGIHKNPLFIGIIMFTVVAQYFIVEFGGNFVKCAGLNQDQWIKCILLGSLSLPLGGIMRLLPVANSASDYATVSDLIKTNQEGSTETKKKSEDGFTFFVWFVVVTALPVMTYQCFKEHWDPLIAAAMTSA